MNAVAAYPSVLFLEDDYNSAPFPDDSLLAFIAKQIDEVEEHYRAPASRQTVPLAERFRQLAKRWLKESAHASSTTAIAMNPAYQQIIALGRDALPLILAELEREPRQWFWALRVISGVDPVPPNQRGQVREMQRTWLQWGRDEGLSW
jgi:hypothetical protein